MYSETAFGWLGHHAINRIQRLCQHADNLYSRAAQVPRSLRRTLRNYAQKIQRKIQNLVDELHKKVAHFLVTNYDIILLPTFETQQMTRRGARKLRVDETSAHIRITAGLKEQKTTMEMTITLNKEQTQQLEKLAKHCSVHPQELVRAAINDFLSRPSEDFLRSAHYVVEKNEELYKRLS